LIRTKNKEQRAKNQEPRAKNQEPGIKSQDLIVVNLKRDNYRLVILLDSGIMNKDLRATDNRQQTTDN
jgi:hypothetical protein